MRRRILFVISLTTLLIENLIIYLFRNKSTNYNTREKFIYACQFQSQAFPSLSRSKSWGSSIGPPAAR